MSIFYVLVREDTGELFTPPMTRKLRGQAGTARAYTSAGRAKAAGGRRKDLYVLRMDTDHDGEVAT